MNSGFCNGVHDPRFNQRNASHISFLLYLQNKRAHENNLNKIEKRKSKSSGATLRNKFYTTVAQNNKLYLNQDGSLPIGNNSNYYN